MTTTKRSSITSKIIVSYVLAAVLAAVAFWVIYDQINNYTESADIEDDNSEKLFLISTAITDMYEAESLGRNITKTLDKQKIARYRSKIDSVNNTITKIAKISEDSTQMIKVDSIKKLLSKKNENLNELINIYSKRQKKSYYSQAIKELQKVDETFMDTGYKNRFNNLKPYQKDLWVKYLEYFKEDNAHRLSNKTVDSLANSMKQVLNKLDLKDQQLRKSINQKEDELLKNDLIISAKLRDFLSAVEQQEIKTSFHRVKASQQMLSKTSQTIALVAILSIISVLVFLFLINKDIAKSQRYRNELEHAKVYAESLLTSKQSFMNMITHDLRSPLNTVLGYSELLQKTELDKKQAYYLSNLKKSSEYTMHLVNSLLDFSKLEAGKMLLEKLPFYPDKLIKDAVMVAIPITDKSDLSIRIHTEETLGDQVLGDPFRIKQILTNLITNAYKFTPKGSITISALYTAPKEGLEKKILKISVRDTGIGMDKAQQEIVFKEFSQADIATEKKYGGSGLGLAITKKIITLLGGRITLESSPKMGSEFVVYIPVTSLNIEESATQERAMNTFSSTLFEGKRLLILDDEPTQLALTNEVVSKVGFTFDAYSDPLAALEQLENEAYDLILTDIQMPGMNGFEFLEAIQNTKAKIPVIALSGRTDISEKEYLEKGFAASIRKPYASDILITLITEILEITPKHLAQNPNQQTLLPSTNGDYSLDDLMAFAQDDIASLHTILEAFYTSTENNLNDFRDYLAQKEFKNVHNIAHKMLPMFRQINAIHIIPLLEKLERAEADRLYPKTIISLSNKAIEAITVLMEDLKREVLDNIKHQVPKIID